jgi:hypothetical protein
MSNENHIIKKIIFTNLYMCDTPSPWIAMTSPGITFNEFFFCVKRETISLLTISETPSKADHRQRSDRISDSERDCPRVLDSINGNNASYNRSEIGAPRMLLHGSIM